MSATTESPPDPEKAKGPAGNQASCEDCDLQNDLELLDNVNLPPKSNYNFLRRPGISPTFLERHKIRHVSAEEAVGLVGYMESGLYIPYPALNAPHGTQLKVNDKDYGRIRKDHASNGSKYLQPQGTGAQLYAPPGLPFQGGLVLVEGEFKVLALAEQGIRAVGIGGICSAMHEGELIPDLAHIVRKYRLNRVYFLGDSDTAVNFDFAREAVKIAKALPGDCELKLPRIPLAKPKGIDDCREKLGEGFLEFWQGIKEQAIAVSTKADPSTLAVRLLADEWPTIAQERDEYLPPLMKLATRLDPVALNELCQKAKAHLGIPIGTFKSQATKRSHEDTSEAKLPEVFFDGVSYFRQSKGGFDRVSRDDTSLALRSMGFPHRTASNCEVSPCEHMLYRIQQENRVDYAIPLCGRPVGIWQEQNIKVLCTRGPTILKASEGDPSPMEQFLMSLLGHGRDSFFQEQYMTFFGWIARARQALRDPKDNLPGQCLALVGPRDCGKSLLQSLITLMLGGREADPSLWLIKNSLFNSDIWAAEHLRLGDEDFEQNSERHSLRERIKKVVTATVYPLHPKHREAKNFRPIWRLTVSSNEEGDALAALPPLSDSFHDKVIYLKCYPPLRPYHNGSDEENKVFFERLAGALPAFLHKVETLPLLEGFQSSRFYVKEFHHPLVLELLADASPVAPLGELLYKWLGEIGGEIEDCAVELFEKLCKWNQYTLVNYTKSARHFGHQLSRLKELPGWKDRISSRTRRIGPNKQLQTVWKLTR